VLSITGKFAKEGKTFTKKNLNSSYTSIQKADQQQVAKLNKKGQPNQVPQGRKRKKGSQGVANEILAASHDSVLGPDKLTSKPKVPKTCIDSGKQRG